MTVVRVNETVATCKRDVPDFGKWLGQEYEIYTAVCLIENLEIMTDTQTKEVTLHFSHDDGETTTTVRAEVEYYEYYHQYDQKWLREFRVEFLEAFDKSVHGAWQMELSEQIKTL